MAERNRDQNDRLMVGASKAQEGEKIPQKRFFRQRAHCNPLSHHSNFDRPISPDDCDWSEVYPQLTNSDGKLMKEVTIADVGCGFGGLLFGLQKLYHDKVMLGMEIRMKVTEFVRLKILASRKQSPGEFQNVGVLRTNSMRYMPNFFRKGQLEKLFFCFPDPHFKRAKHRWRIVSPSLLSEYAYCLRPGGIIYTITDVEELHIWMRDHINNHPCFEPLLGDELESDPCVEVMRTATEEGKKVARNGGKKFVAVFKRIHDKKAIMAPNASDFWNGPKNEL